jgi:hypothetical protein
LGDTRQLAEAPRAGLSEEYGAGLERAAQTETASSGLFGTLFTPYSDYRMIMCIGVKLRAAIQIVPPIAYRRTARRGPPPVPCRVAPDSTPLQDQEQD